MERAASNGYNNNGTTNIVEVHIPPVSGPYVRDEDYIQVIITSHVRMMFARVFGRQFITNKVEAVTLAETGSSDTSDGLAAIAALAPSGTGVTMNGNVNLDVINSGVFSNSNSGACPSGSMVAIGNADLDVDTDFAMGTGGTFCQSGSVNLNGDPIVPTSQIPYPPTFINPPAPSITCTGTGSISGNVVSPGTFASTFSLPAWYTDYTFEPGNYCFDNGANINGNFNLTANDVQFRVNGSSFTINGNSTFSGNNVLFHGVGGPGVDILGVTATNLTNVTFYMSAGTVYFSGTSANTLSAPTDGVYKGLLIYLPYGNNSPLTIEGNANQHFTGSIIGVSSNIEVKGNNATFSLDTQFVGYTFTISGNANFTVNYNPDLQYLPPEGPAIELIE
jgi:hypothetical protein